MPLKYTRHTVVVAPMGYSHLQSYVGFHLQSYVGFHESTDEANFPSSPGKKTEQWKATSSTIMSYYMKNASGRSHHGPAVTNPTSIHEDVGLIPVLAQ